MGAAIPLREDFDGGVLRHLARFRRDAKQTHRLLPLARIYDGWGRLDAVERWSLKDLAAWILFELGIVIDERTVYRKVKIRAMGV